ncbi:hypothetical protein B1F69_16550 [Pseudomonas syringae]|nr:hypothetical protein B1F69_16550 [Pseudomonas syringae]
MFRTSGLLIDWPHWYRFLILAEGRRSELVREDGSSDNASSENVTAHSRTNSLHALRAESKAK